jgi:FdhE protein
VTTATATSLADVARQREDWRPWLALLDAVAAAARDDAWRWAVPPAEGGDRAPWLAGRIIALDERLLRRWTRRLFEVAAAAGGAAVTLPRAVSAEAEHLVRLFEAALEQDAARLTAAAPGVGVDPEALAAVAALLPAPLLRACAAAAGEAATQGWPHGYCPVCGAWPVLAEARGLERARRLRCGRCAADWNSRWLLCVYCGAEEHARLRSLVLVDGNATPHLVPAAASVDACTVCRGYLKTVTTLAPTPADELGLLDLATVELDVVALEQDYVRPPGLGAPLGARVQLRQGRLWRPWRG